jgi:hypothetical protein
MEDPPHPLEHARLLRQRVQQAVDATVQAIERSRTTRALAVETRLKAQEVVARDQGRRQGKDMPSPGEL